MHAEALFQFIKTAERTHKYKPNTASALAGTLRLFVGVMTERELSGEDFPIDKLDELVERLRVKNQGKYSAGSLQTYKIRISRIVRDYMNYGLDAKSMASWNPLPNQRRRVRPKSNAPQDLTRKQPAEDSAGTLQVGGRRENAAVVHDIQLPLANNRNAVLYYPTDLTEDEAEKIGIALKGIAALASSGRRCVGMQ